MNPKLKLGILLEQLNEILDDMMDTTNYFQDKMKYLHGKREVVEKSLNLLSKRHKKDEK